MHCHIVALALCASLSVVAANYYELLKEYTFTDMATVRNDWIVEVHPPGWVNEEYQAYVDDGSTIWTSGGRLFIKAYRRNGQYFSGRLKSKLKFTPAVQVGHKMRVEFVAKVPTNSGGWPALWMLGDYAMYGSWPRCGEIDVMEWVHQSGEGTTAALHWKGPEDWGTKFMMSRAEIASTFITYGVEYSNRAYDEYVEFYVIRENGDKIYGPKVSKNVWIWNDFPSCNYQYSAEATKCSFAAPFDNPHELILNVAVGGNWGNCCGVQPSDYNAFDAGVIMEVKSVKVYKTTCY